MTEIPATLSDPYMPTIIPDMGTDGPKMDREKKYLEKNNFDETIHQKLRKEDVYENYMHKI